MPASNFVASGNISPCRIVKLSGDFEVAQAGDGEQAIGVAQEGLRRAPGLDGTDAYAAIDGESLQVFQEGDECLVECSGVIAAGTRVDSDANGKATAISNAAAGDKESVGYLLENSTADGHKVRMRVNITRWTEA